MYVRRMNLIVPRVVWAFIMMLPFIYYVIATGVGGPESAIDAAMLGVMGAMAGLWVAAGYFIPRFLLKRRLRAKGFAVSGEGESRRFTEPERVKTDTRAAFLLPFVVGVVCSVVPAVYGVVLAFMGGSPMYWAPFIASGAILVALRFPVERRILGRAEAAYDARMP